MTTNDQNAALGLISSIKLNQVGALALLRARKTEARKQGDTAKAIALGRAANELSHQNLTLHRAKLKVQQTMDLSVVNQRLSALVRESNEVHKELQQVVDVLGKTAELVALIRRTVDVFT